MGKEVEEGDVVGTEVNEGDGDVVCSRVVVGGEEGAAVHY